MSTPMSIDSPRVYHSRTDSEQKRDLQEKIQRMIALQHLESSDDNIEDIDPGIFPEERYDPQKGLSNRADAGPGNRNSVEASGVVKPERSTGTFMSPRSSENQLSRDRLPPPSPHSGIGRGTLVFPTSFENQRRESSTESDPSILSAGRRQLDVPPLPSSQPPPPPPQQGGSWFPPSQIYTGYGTLQTTAPSAASRTYGDLQHFQAGIPNSLQQHDFHYGNLDFHDPDGDDATPQRKHSKLSSCARDCCLYSPLTYIFLRDNIHRSFCFGAIDGMLTGSGITSAFCALQVLSSTASWPVREAVVVFTVAACVADALCMAIGHVWTSLVVSSGHAQDRSRERLLLNNDKGNAKARLVEMLLSRGMLKIDAMSLADTLEGYPDMFVNVLLGDSLFAGTDLPEEDETDDGQDRRPLMSVGGVRDATTGSFGGLSWKFPSYGGFNEMEHDPEAHAVSAVWKDSQMEGIAMMLGFSTFAIIPSLLWLLLPPLLISDSPAVTSGSLSTSTKSDGDVISLPSLVVSICGFIMWFLGGWKSRYLESSWIMSGIESVVVLLACVLSAYGVGYGLSYVVGGENGVILTNVASHGVTLTTVASHGTTLTTVATHGSN